MTTRIGITTYGRNGNNQFYLPAQYVDAIRRAGATAYLLPPGDDNAAAQLEDIDGLIITGGGDIDPKIYQGKQHELNYLLDAERDSSELALAQQALKKQLPIFAICRGMQVINVIEGGTLYEHLPEHVGEEILHRSEEKKPIPHSVTINENSHLANIVGAQKISVMSWHHQAIRKLANSLVVTAHSDDNVIEAIEMPDYPWLIGVQWHPEICGVSDDAQQKIFTDFVQFCRNQSVRKIYAVEK